MSVLTACIIILTMLTLSAFFSGMEIAFIGSNRLKLEIDRRQNAFFDFAAGVFTRNSGMYIATMLVANNLILVIYSLAVSKLFTTLLGHGSVVLETLAATSVIIFVGDYIPKSLVLKNPNFYFRIFAFPVFLFYVMLFPLAKITTWISAGIIRLFGRKPNDEPMELFSRADLVDLVEETVEELPEHEVKLFQNALDFSNLPVRDCMVQRINVESAEITDDIGQLTAKFLDSQYSRIFIWEKSIDNIVGYVNVKSLFDLPKTIEQAIKPVEYVPETMPAQELLTNFIKNHSSIAVVTDEFGGTAGIVSLEDILEEIFGEIEDEHDTPKLTEKRTADGEYIFSCQLKVDYLNEKYGLQIAASDDYDTLAGYIIFNYHDIPPQGEVITIGNLRIKILKRTSSKVEVARIWVL